MQGGALLLKSEYKGIPETRKENPRQCGRETKGKSEGETKQQNEDKGYPLPVEAGVAQGSFGPSLFFCFFVTIIGVFTGNKARRGAAIQIEHIKQNGDNRQHRT